jgi:hypothetical protein
MSYTTEMTTTELDALLAEQLPARELMGGWRPKGGCGCGGNEYHGGGLINVSDNNVNVQFLNGLAFNHQST